jgi:hypothetical protein
MNGDNLTIIFVIACGVGVLLWLYNAREKDCQNAQTLVYARFVGVWPVLPLTPFDDSVQARADALREAFAAHGNTNAQVVEYVYGMPIDGRPTASIQYAQFLTEAVKDYLQRVDAFIADKAKKDSKAAAQHIGGQTVVLEISNKEYLKP